MIETSVRLHRISCQPSEVGADVTRSRPVLFVHGAWHGAWCWAEHFLPYFASHGYRSYAFDLRGHGGSAGGHRLRSTRIVDYVADLEQVVGELDAEPVLVGHSMGGVIVQKYVEVRPAAGAVLLASVPPGGALAIALRLAARHPWAMLRATISRSLRPIVATPRLAREAFFDDRVPADRLAAYFHRLQDESYRAFLDLVGLDRQHPERVRAPMLVLGAARDTFLTRAEVDATARAYRTEATLFPMAHDMMLEDGWQDVADHILRWMDELPKR